MISSSPSVDLSSITNRLAILEAANVSIQSSLGNIFPRVSSLESATSSLINAKVNFSLPVLGGTDTSSVASDYAETTRNAFFVPRTAPNFTVPASGSYFVTAQGRISNLGSNDGDWMLIVRLTRSGSTSFLCRAISDAPPAYSGFLTNGDNTRSCSVSQQLLAGDLVQLGYSVGSTGSGTFYVGGAGVKGDQSLYGVPLFSSGTLTPSSNVAMLSSDQTATLSSLTSRMSAAESAATQLSGVVSTHSTLISALQAANISAQGAIVSVTSRMTSAEFAANALSGAVGGLQSQSNLQGSTLSQQANTLILLSSANSSLQTSVSALTTRVQQLEIANQSVQASSLALTSRVQLLESANMTLTGTIASLSSRVSALESTGSAQQNALLALHSSQISSLNSSQLTQSLTLLQLRSANSSLSSRIAALESSPPSSVASSSAVGEQFLGPSSSISVANGAILTLAVGTVVAPSTGNMSVDFWYEITPSGSTTVIGYLFPVLTDVATGSQWNSTFSTGTFIKEAAASMILRRSGFAVFPVTQGRLYRFDCTFYSTSTNGGTLEILSYVVGRARMVTALGSPSQSLSSVDITALTNRVGVAESSILSLRAANVSVQSSALLLAARVLTLESGSPGSSSSSSSGVAFGERFLGPSFSLTIPTGQTAPFSVGTFVASTSGNCTIDFWSVYCLRGGEIRAE